MTEFKWTIEKSGQPPYSMLLACWVFEGKSRLVIEEYRGRLGGRFRWMCQSGNPGSSTKKWQEGFCTLASAIKSAELWVVGKESPEPTKASAIFCPSCGERLDGIALVRQEETAP